MFNDVFNGNKTETVIKQENSNTNDIKKLDKKENKKVNKNIYDVYSIDEYNELLRVLNETFMKYDDNSSSETEQNISDNNTDHKSIIKEIREAHDIKLYEPNPKRRRITM